MTLNRARVVDAVREVAHRKEDAVLAKVLSLDSNLQDVGSVAMAPALYRIMPRAWLSVTEALAQQYLAPILPCP